MIENKWHVGGKISIKIDGLERRLLIITKTVVILFAYIHKFSVKFTVKVVDFVLSPIT